MAINHIVSPQNARTVTVTELTDLLSTLQQGTNPLTGEVPTESCLHATDVQTGLDNLIRSLRDRQAVAEAITEEDIRSLCTALRELDYQPTVAQLARVFTGSRSIADPRLRGLKGYKQYRGVFSRRVVTNLLRRHTELIEGPKPVPVVRGEEPWRTVDFFDTDAFDNLEEEKATELYREVTRLGVQKPTERLPLFMARARKHQPRAFEPWTREERALLIEAMCYTNDGEKLASIFGRSTSAVRQEGKRLIWNSQQKVA